MDFQKRGCLEAVPDQTDLSCGRGKILAVARVFGMVDFRKDKVSGI